MIAILTSFIILVAYIVVVRWYTNGIPSSLSETYYTMGRLGWLFPLCMCAVSATLFPVWVKISEGHEYLSFLACSSLVFVALTPSYRADLQKVVHYTAAVVCGVCAVMWQILEGLWDVTLFFGFVGGILVLQNKDKYMFILECAIVLSLYTNIIRVL